MNSSFHDLNCQKISVVIPTLDRWRFLIRAIESVRTQTLQADEIIIVDNGSTDGTLNLLKSKYPMVKLICESKSGVSAARNRGIKAANGNLIALLDSDDAWHPRKLEEQLKVWEREKSRIIHTDEIWYRNGVVVNQMAKHKKSGGDIFKNCLSLCCISPSSVLIDKSLFYEVGFFDEDLVVCEDYDMWLRMTAFEEVSHIGQPLTIKYGGHKGQLSVKYWGMDRFRIQSLEKILKNVSLNPGQRDLTQKMLIYKLKIFINGAVKRGNHHGFNLYEKKLRYWRELIMQENLLN